jgi:hypothetical protein
VSRRFVRYRLLKSFADTLCIQDTKLIELDLPEGPVLELLNAVSIAKRMANMVRCFVALLSFLN